jgi:outer membrane protein assembly factor BamB
MPTDKNQIKWTFDTHGGYMASPIAAGGLVYVANLYNFNADRYYALDQDTGDVKWQYPGSANIIQQPVVTDQGTAYLGGSNFTTPTLGSIIAVNAATGQQTWTVNTPAPVTRLVASDGIVYYAMNAQLHAMRAFDQQPLWAATPAGNIDSGLVVSDHFLYCGTDDGYFVSLQCADGQLQWRLQVGNPVRGGPAIDADGILFGTNANSVWKVTLPTGQLLWQAPTSSPVLTPIAVRDGMVCFCDLVALYLVRSVDGHQLWTHPLPGYGGGPVFAEDLVLIGIEIAHSANNPGLLIAVDAIAGQERWRVQTDSAVASPAAFAQPIAYAGSWQGKLYAIDLHLAWSFKTTQPLLAPAAVSGTTVFFGGSDSQIYAIDSNVGAEIWTYKTNAAVDTEVLFDTSSVYVAGRDHFLHALDAPSGHLLWKTDLGAALISRPAIGGSVVCVPSADGHVYGLKSSDGTKQWDYNVGSPALISRFVVDGISYAAAADGSVVAIGIADGQVKWRTMALAAFDAPPCVGTNLLFAAAADGKLYALDLASGAVKWQFDSGSPIYAEPVTSNGLVYFGNSAGLVHAVNQATGATIWKFGIPQAAAVNASPALSVDGPPLLCVGSDDGTAYILDPLVGKPVWKYRTDGAVRGCAAGTGRMFYSSSSDGYLYALR